MKATGHGQSDVGRQRQLNEDSLLVDDALGFFAVSDGMGGHAAGEIASAMAVAIVRREISARGDLLAHAAAGDEDAEALQGLVRGAIDAACREIYERAASGKGQAGMGCTLTLALVAGSKIVMGHVGDSRLYLVREGAVHQLSQDHTVVQELVRRGALTTEQGADSPYANVLSRAVGTKPAVQVDTLAIDALPGDRLLLCSDGLTAYVTDEAWLGRAISADPVEEVPGALVDFANAGGGRDNITALLVRLDVPAAEVERTAAITTAVTTKMAALDSHFLFQGLPLALAGQVIQQVVIEDYQAGETVVAEGDRCDRLMMVDSGHLSLLRGTTVVARLGHSQFVGASMLLRERHARLTLRADRPSRLITLRRSAFRELVGRHPQLGVDLLARLTVRFSRQLDRAAEHLLRTETSLTEETVVDLF